MPAPAGGSSWLRRSTGGTSWSAAPAQWLAWRCGLTPRTAREHVRIARSLGRLPAIKVAFARGQVSFAKVRALTRVAEPANEENLIELALELTAAQLERALRAYRRVT